MAKHLHHIEIEPSENGGHTVRHHYRETTKDRHAHSGVSFVHHEPESHVFGPEEGHDMLAHVANHLKIKEEPETEEEDNEDEEDE